MAESWSVGAARDLPLSDDDSWDGGAAEASIFAWAGGDTIDGAKAKRGFLLYDSSAPELRGSYKLPFAKVQGGKLVASRAGLRAAASRLPQTDAPDDVLSRARAVIDHYQKKVDDTQTHSAPPPEGRIRLAIFSEVKLDSQGNARPIHMLRTGTFTDSSGKPCTFGPEHIKSIVANYAKRPNPPITESHDWGRAVGRTTQLYTDAAGENLYGLPKWNAAGKQMLIDGVYDGYSCELDPDDSGGFIKIGGSLTNYPAVSGLQAVTLAAPAIDDPFTYPTEVPTMAEPNQVDPPVVPPTTPPVTPPVTPPAVPPITLAAPDSPIFQAQMQAALTQMQAQYELQAKQALESAQLQFERWKSEQSAQQEIAQFAQHVTSATLQRPYALPLDADRVSKFMASIPAEARKEARAIFEQVLSAGLISFEELGSQAAGKDEADPVQAYEEALAAEIKLTGIRSQAISNLMRKQPEIVSAYNAAKSSKKGGR